jgi:lipid A disaccharide synthetase
MTKFVDIYLRVVKKKTALDDIVVEELPVGIQRDIQENKVQERLQRMLKDRDKERAQERLDRIQEQLRKVRMKKEGR